MNRYDVVVAGGGLVGGALACALAQAGLGVAVVDAGMPVPLQDTEAYDLRVSAVTLGSAEWLDAIGVWPRVRAARVGLLARMEVWEARRESAIHFDAAEAGQPCLGFIVENRVLLAAAGARLDELGVARFAPAQVCALHADDAHARVTLEDGRQLEAALVVGADGSRSWLRRALGIDARLWSYDQLAVVATISLERDNDAKAWQRFMPDGVVALLPLDRRRVSLVASYDAPAAHRLLALSEADFAAALDAAFEGAPGPIRLDGARASFPLGAGGAARYSVPRFALVGDSAHWMHPLAGQGVNLGFGDARALARVLGLARDLGAARTLRTYERERRLANAAMLVATDGLKRLFAARARALRVARNAGLRALDRSTAAKRAIMRYAMGTSAVVPLASLLP